MYAIIAFIPLVFTVIVMAGFNWGAKQALPVAWLITAIIAFSVWKKELGSVAAYSVQGMLNSLDTIVIVFGANLIMNTLKASGGMAVINKGFSTLTPDRRIQMIIVALQNLGGAIGNMTCINNIVSACATTGTVGREGLLVKRDAIPMVIYSLTMVVLMSIVIFVLKINPYPLG